MPLLQLLVYALIEYSVQRGHFTILLNADEPDRKKIVYFQKKKKRLYLPHDHYRTGNFMLNKSVGERE